MSNSNGNTRTRKSKARPGRPFKGFPLSPHASGMWQKKIRGKLHYFGRWARQIDGRLVQLPADEWWEPALALWKAQKDDLLAGRVPKEERAGAVQLGDLCNDYLHAKGRKLAAREITKATLLRQRSTTDMIIGQFGRAALVEDLGPDDFADLRAAMVERWGPARLSNEVVYVRSVFRWGFDNDKIERPVKFGSDFKPPGADVLRKHKAGRPKKMFAAEECRQLLAAASVPLRAAMLLALNAGYGNTDCSALPLDSLDLDTGWADFPRPKTGVERRSPLWPETITAIRDMVASRPESARGAKLVFTTRTGRPWPYGDISKASSDLMKAVGVHRPGVGFYALRHVFRTIADGCRDQVAVNHIMGHSDHSMAGVYREYIEDDRLRAVADHVHAWLWPVEGGGA